MMVRSLALFLVGILFLSVLAVGTGGQAAKEGKILIVEDPEGDVSHFLGPSTPVPNPLTQHVDVTAVEVGPDSTDTLSLTFQFAGTDPTMTQVGDTVAFWGRYCYLYWSYESKADFGYYLNIATDRDLDDPTSSVRLRSELNFYYDGGDDWNWDWTDKGHTITADEATGRIIVEIQKDFVPYFPGARAAAKGDQLVLGGGGCGSDTAGVWYYDWVDANEARYAMQAEGAGEVVSVSFGGTTSGGSSEGMTWQFPDDAEGLATTSISKSGQSLVPVTLHNLASDKKLVMLSATAIEKVDGWNVSIAPSVFLKPKESRVVNLIVSPPAGAAIGDGLEVEVKAEVAAEDAVGVAKRRLVVAPQLDADNNVLHFHALKYGSGSTFEPVSDAVRPYYDLKMSLSETEEGYERGVLQNGLFEQWLWDYTEPLSATPAILSAEEPATFDLKVAGQEGAVLDLLMYMGSDDDGTLYYHEGEYPVGTHTISLTPRFGEDLELPSGARFWIEMQVDDPMGVMDVGLDLSGTRITLPVEAVEKDVTVTDGRFLPNLRLAPGEEKVTYVNPGKEYAFDLNLSNDGLEEDDLHVTAVIENATGWTAKVLPGARFRVPSGESTPVTVSVSSPAGAAEGDIAMVKVTAKSKHDPEAQTSISLRAIATTGVELEEKKYEEKADQLPALTDTEEGPLGLLPALVAFVGALAVLRRRRA